MPGELKREMMDQMRVLSEELLKEVRAQLPAREEAQAAGPPPDRYRAPTRGSRAQTRQMGPAYQYDAEGRPICRRCGEAGHIQRRCGRRAAGAQDF